MAVRGYETYSTVMNGQTVLLHRCYECVRLMWLATGVPENDNGFVSASQPLSHLPDCSLYRDGREGRKCQDPPKKRHQP